MRLIFSFLFIHSFSFVQSQVVVSETSMNVLYRGIENQVEIAVSGWDSEDLTIIMMGGSKEKLSDGSYSVLPSNIQKVRMAEITVYGGGEAIFLGDN